MLYMFVQEAEARIVRVLQPELCLDPTPKLDRLYQDPVPHKVWAHAEQKNVTVIGMVVCELSLFISFS